MNEIRIKNNMLENKNFKYVVFTGTLIIGGLVVFGILPNDIGIFAVLGSAIMNLGYIPEVRDSSKVDFFYIITSFKLLLLPHYLNKPQTQQLTTWSIAKWV